MQKSHSSLALADKCLYKFFTSFTELNDKIRGSEQKAFTDVNWLHCECLQKVLVIKKLLVSLCASLTGVLGSPE